MSKTDAPSAKESAVRIARTTARQAEKKRAEWTRRRDQAIRIARFERASFREIGAATGLSHVAVQKIVAGSPPSSS